MKATLRIDVEIDDSFFKNEEEKQLFYGADKDSQTLWLQERAFEQLNSVIYEEFIVEKLEL